MRSVAFTFGLLAISASLLAQGVFSNKVNATLEKVIQDYPNRFKNIKGEIIIQNPQTTEFRSTVEIPGSTSCTVTRYSSSKNDVYSWACVIFESEEFEQAKNKFKELFGQIKNSIVKIEGEKPFILTGQYENPTEEKKFTTVVFELLPAVGEMKKVKIDLSMQYLMSSGWKISLSVYDRDRKDEEQGAVSVN
jgi:hypothetical protein